MICPNCHDANSCGDYEGPTCEVCGGEGHVMPVRIQRKRTKGWRMPPNTVSVTRPGKWGNPFQVGKNRCHGHGERFRQEPIKDAATAVRFFREMLTVPDRNYPTDAEIAAELSGKNLACFCPIDKPCHADVLLEMANGITAVVGSLTK